MQASDPQTPFESFCPSCRVSFPLEQKRCIHCGRRLSRDRDGQGPAVSLPPGSQDLDSEDELSQRSGALSPMTLVWIAVLLAGYLYRACAS